MPRVSNIEVVEQAQQHTITVKAMTPVEGLPKLIGESYGKMAAYLGELGECLADVPFVAYHSMDMQNMDVEIGFPVTKALQSRGDIKEGSIPAGKKAICMYRGPYQDIGGAYDDMAKWFEEKGYPFPSVCYECYLNGPEFPESEWLTKIVIPIE